MESQIPIKPSYNVEIKKNMKTHAAVSETIDQQYTTCKFRSSSDINGVFKQNKYLDYVIPSGFNDISKISQVVIDLECEASKLIQPQELSAQTLFLTVVSPYPDPDLNGITLTDPANTETLLKTIPINSVTGVNLQIAAFNDVTLANNGNFIFGTYTFSGITASTSSPASNTSLRMVIALYSSTTGYTVIANTPYQLLTGVATPYSFAYNFTSPVAIDGQQLRIYYQAINGIANPLVTTVTLTWDNVAAAESKLVRNIYNYTNEYVQNTPVWTIFDRIELLINGKVADMISTYNYFCELALHSRETLREYSKTIMIDPDNYGLLFNYPGAILMRNTTASPLTITERFRYQIPLFSTFLTSEHYLTDFVRDQITVRVWFRPYDLFKISANNNHADTLSVVSTALYLTGPKFEEADILKLRYQKGSNPLVSMILLRKYGSDKLIRSQQTTHLTYAPIYGQSLYDLSFLNGRYICLFTFLAPENVISGENYCQLALTTNSASTDTNYISNPLTVVGNINQTPIKNSAQASKSNLNGYEYTYTPESAFRLDRVSLINQLGVPIYQNLQYADFLRNAMSTTGVNNDFLKTYAVYPMYFSNQIHEDYRNQHGGHGYLTMKDIYNIEIILSNPESSSLPFYNGSGTLVNTLQNSLYTCGLQIAQMHIRSNGRIEIMTE